MANRNGFVPLKLAALWRKHRMRRVGYAVMLLILAPAWYVTPYHFMVSVELMIGTTATAVTTWIWLRAADRPVLDRLIECPASAVLVDHAERGGGWFDLRVILASGDELRFRVTPRELRQYGQMLAGFCRKAEFRLPGLIRSASV